MDYQRQALVDYQVNENETGLTGWVWRVDGDFGSAPTLAAAMKTAKRLRWTL